VKQIEKTLMILLGSEMNRRRGGVLLGILGRGSICGARMGEETASAESDGQSNEGGIGPQKTCSCRAGVARPERRPF